MRGAYQPLWEDFLLRGLTAYTVFKDNFFLLCRFRQVGYDGHLGQIVMPVRYDGERHCEQTRGIVRESVKRLISAYEARTV